jgi:hypothetical protein
MPTLPTACERTDTALTLAKTRAAAYADAGNLEMAYKALLRGVQSAQRVNGATKVGTAVAGLWAMPAVKAAVLGGPALIATAVTRSKSKSKSKSKSGTGSTPGDPSTSSLESSASAGWRGRFQRRPGTTDETAAAPVSSASVTIEPND